MNQNLFTVEQIIRMLREAEVHLSQGKSVEFCLWTGRRRPRELEPLLYSIAQGGWQELLERLQANSVPIEERPIQR